MVGPDSPVERFQQGALQQRQRPLHFASAESQRVLALRDVPEAKGVQLLHLRTPQRTEGIVRVRPGREQPPCPLVMSPKNPKSRRTEGHIA